MSRIETTVGMRASTSHTFVEVTVFVDGERMPIRFTAHGRSGIVEWNAGGFGRGDDAYARKVAAAWQVAIAEADRVQAVMAEHPDDVDARIAALMALVEEEAVEGVMSAYFIIEHPARGCFKGDWTETGLPSFSSSAMRNAENVQRFQTAEAAARVRDTFPERIRERSQVRSSVPQPSSGPMGDNQWPVVA